MAEKTFDRSRCRMAAFDLDGTLVRDFALIPSGAVVKALNDLKASGVYVVLSSGRDLSQVHPDMLKCFSYAVLTNGSCIMDVASGKLIWSERFAWTVLYRTVKKLEKLGGYCFLMQNGVIRARQEGEKLVAATMGEKLSGENIIGGYSGTGTRYTNVFEATGPFAAPTYKMQVFFHSREDCSRAYEELKKDKKLQVLTMFGTTIEVTAAGVTKAAALDILCGKLGLEPGSYAAFGDSRNDLEMLEAAAFAVVMENGEQCVKDIADYIALPVTEDGAAKAIYELYDI